MLVLLCLACVESCCLKLSHRRKWNLYLPNLKIEKADYRSSEGVYRQRNCFELILHVIADTDTDKHDFGIKFS